MLSSYLNLVSNAAWRLLASGENPSGVGDKIDQGLTAAVVTMIRQASPISHSRSDSAVRISIKFKPAINTAGISGATVHRNGHRLKLEGATTLVYTSAFVDGSPEITPGHIEIDVPTGMSAVEVRDELVDVLAENFNEPGENPKTDAIKAFSTTGSRIMDHGSSHHR